jgi:hypothetical protein
MPLDIRFAISPRLSGCSLFAWREALNLPNASPFKNTVELWNTLTSKGLGAWGRRCLMPIKRTSDEWDKWCRAKDRVGEELRKYYQACATKALSPRLLALTEKFNEEHPTEETPLVRDIEN